MKTKQIFEKLSNQWPAKIICFVTALLLFFFYQISQMNAKSVSVKLTVNSVGPLIPVSSYPKHVRVTVRTSPDNITKITEEGISAVLNISNYAKPGDYNVPVTLDLDSDLLLIDPLEVHVEPDSIPLTLDKKTFSYVNVKPSLAGSLPHGYETGTIVVTPDSLRVSGPSSMVSQVQDLLTDKVDLDRHMGNFTEQVKIVKTNSLLDIENDESVSVSVEVRPIRIEKSYTGIHIYFTYLADNLKVEGIPPSVSFKISGDQNTVENLTIDDYTVQADCSSITRPGEHELPLLYLLPATLKVEEKSADTVKVIFVTKPAEPDSGQTR